MFNSSTVKFLTLSGLQGIRNNGAVYFTFTLLIYLLIILMNMTLIIIIIHEKSLHEPMYIFLCNLCINCLYGTAGFYPKMLVDLLSDVHVISYSGCMAQAYVIYSSVCCEIPILTVMAYDRYVAICKPLEYHAIMIPLMITRLLLFAWVFPLSWCWIISLLTLRLPLCNSHIEKLYCDNWSIVKLSCVSFTENNVFGYILILLLVAQVMYILYSYSQIVCVCLRSQEGRVKFMQTCLPHVLTIINFILAALFDVMYSRYSFTELPLSLRNILAVEFLTIPPLVNPIVYGLQLKKIRNILFRISNGCKRSSTVINPTTEKNVSFRIKSDV